MRERERKGIHIDRERDCEIDRGREIERERQR